MEVKLNIKDKTLTGLAGNPLGKEIYKSQVKSFNPKSGEKLTIVFPETIENVSYSFVQGFFSELQDKMGVTGIKENTIIKPASLSRQVFERLY